MTNLPREELEKKANATRSRLLSAVDELDRRRHAWADIAERAKRAAVPLAVGLGVFALATAGVVAWGLARLRRPTSRLRALRNAWSSPRPEPSSKPWYAELVRRILLSALTFAGTRIARRMMEQRVRHLTRGDGQSETAAVSPRIEHYPS